MSITITYLLMVLVLAGLAVLCVAVFHAARRSKSNSSAQQNYGQPYPVPPPAPAPYAQPDTGRLQCVYSSGGFLTTRMEIFADAATGAEYLVVTGGSGVAVTPMVRRGNAPEERTE